MNKTAWEAGWTAGQAVKSGRLSAERAGDRWLRFADRSHAQGVAFLRAFDATGAQR